MAGAEMMEDHPEACGLEGKGCEGQVSILTSSEMGLHMMRKVQDYVLEGSVVFSGELKP